MKILQVVTAFPPSTAFGGAPLVAYEISKRLSEKKHVITVFTSNAFDEKKRVDPEKNKFQNLDVKYFNNISNSIAFNYKIFLTPDFLREVRRSLKDFDIIHLHGYRTIQNLVILYYASKYNIPYVIQPHGSIPSTTMGSKIKIFFKTIYDKTFGFRILKNASSILVLNDTEYSRCLDIVGRSNIQIIPNGISLSKYENLPKKGFFKKKFGIGDEVQIILYLGRINESKGIDLLLRSFVKVSKKIINAKLVVAGKDDGYLDYLINLSRTLKISDKIIFTGFLSHIDKLAAFIDSDAFVTPKFYGFPLTFLEAMVCGCPIVTTSGGDSIDWINDNYGYSSNYNEDLLAENLNTLMTDITLKIKLSENALRDIHRFDWNHIVSNLENIYQTHTEE